MQVRQLDLPMHTWNPFSAIIIHMLQETVQEEAAEARSRWWWRSTARFGMAIW